MSIVLLCFWHKVSCEAPTLKADFLPVTSEPGTIKLGTSQTAIDGLECSHVDAVLIAELGCRKFISIV